MGTLYVGSEGQLGALVAEIAGDAAGPDHSTRQALLDVGSGTGSETSKLAGALGVAAEDVTCIETSRSLRAALTRRGFQIADSLAELNASIFSAAALLNVLDRCDAPAALLDAAVHKVEPGGLLVLATVLPFSARVYEGRVGSPWGTASSREPRAPLALHPAAGKCQSSGAGAAVPADTAEPLLFERSAVVFLEAILRHQPQLELARWTRLPYLSSGDTRETHYAVDMAVMALRVPRGTATGHSAPASEASTPVVAAAAQHEMPLQNSATATTAAAVADAAGGDSRAIPGKCKKRAGDRVFRWLAAVLFREGLAESWGRVLDAGAGFSSMCWLAHQPCSHITEVTASDDGSYGSAELRSAVAAVPRIEVALGNWRNESFMNGRLFDVVVADYLLGATEQHWAYGADQMMDRLLAAVRPGGYLLIVGLEPYELVLDRTAAGSRDRLVLDIEAIGDTAAALAGEPTYRELPERWVRHQVERRGAEFRVVAAERFAMHLTAKSLWPQISYARKMAAKIKDPGLRSAYTARAGELGRELALWSGTHKRARNYALVAQRAPLGAV